MSFGRRKPGDLRVKQCHACLMSTAGRMRAATLKSARPALLACATSAMYGAWACERSSGASTQQQFAGDKRAATEPCVPCHAVAGKLTSSTCSRKWAGAPCAGQHHEMVYDDSDGHSNNACVRACTCHAIACMLHHTVPHACLQWLRKLSLHGHVQGVGQPSGNQAVPQEQAVRAQHLPSQP